MPARSQVSLSDWAASLGRKRSSSPQVIGIVGLLGLLLVALSALFIAWEQHQRLYEEAEKEAQTTAFFLADHAERLFEVAELGLRGSAAALDGLDWDTIQRSEPLWSQLRTIARTLPHVEDIWLNDATGKLRLTTFAFPAPASNVADRDAFKAHMKPNAELFIGEPIVGRVTGRPTFLLSRRLENPDGSFRGVVSVTAEIDYFTAYWKRLRLPYRQRVTLFRAHDLSVLAQYPPGQGRHFDQEKVKAALAAAPDSGRLTDYLEGGERIGSYHRIHGEPAYILVSYAPSAVNAVWIKRVSVYAGFASVALLALAGLTVLSFHQVREEAAALARLEQRVEERTAALRAANEKLALLFQEVNHRVKNSLQIVAGMIQLQMRGLAEPEAQKVLSDALGRLQAVSRVHEQLYKNDVLGAVNADGYLRQLCTDLVGSLVPDGSCTVEIDLDPIEIPLDRAVPLALIVSELMTNAVKYARRDGGGGAVCWLRVSLKRLPEGRMRLEVADNGPGLPPGFRPEGSQSLGMRVVGSLARQLDGTLDFASDPGGGTRVSLETGLGPGEASFLSGRPPDAGPSRSASS